jgi:cytoskeleton protein RodZ
MEPGARLRAAREARDLDLATVAQRTHIAPAALLALEEGRYAELPPLVYVRGFVQQYAAVVGLPADELVAALDQAVPPARQTPADLAPRDSVVAIRRTPDPRLVAGSLALVLVAVVSTVLYGRHSPAAVAWSPVGRTPIPSSTPLPLLVVAAPTVTPLPALVFRTPPLPAAPSPTAVPPPAVPTSTAVPPVPTAAKKIVAAAPTVAAPPTATAVVAPPTATAVAVPPTEAPPVVVESAPVDTTPLKSTAAVHVNPTRVPVTDTVRKGDTLSALARRLGVTQSELARANGLQDPDHIRAGQVLRLP